MLAGSNLCVVFDLDDTLWATGECLAAAHEVMRQTLIARLPDIGAKYGNGYVFAAEMLKTMENNPAREHDFTFLRRETLRRLTGNEGIAAEIYEAWFRSRNNPRLFPGALEALHALRAAGVKVGTLTDGNSDPTRMENGLRDVLDFCVSAADAGVGKPDPQVFALCEARAGLRPSQMLMVGDSFDKDIAGAKRAGWRAVWVRGESLSAVGVAGKWSPSTESEADAVIERAAEVAGLLRMLRRMARSFTPVAGVQARL